MSGYSNVPALLMTIRTAHISRITLGLLLLLALSSCERVYPEPPQNYTPSSVQELRGYFDNLHYDLTLLEQGIPRLVVTDLPDDFTLIDNTRERKRLFIMTLLPLVLITNE